MELYGSLPATHFVLRSSVQAKCLRLVTTWQYTHHELPRISTTVDLQAWRHRVCSRFLLTSDGLRHTPTSI
jgi:hypothetical protein